LSWKSAMGAHLVPAVKNAVSVPVFTAGGISAPLGEKIVENGQADGIPIDRAALADHEYPRNVFGGARRRGLAVYSSHYPRRARAA
jgi:2,4-dienoyl-CoA reductase-like NADH-dependent reductase (Old Yellow Enzyme family)